MYVALLDILKLGIRITSASGSTLRCIENTLHRSLLQRAGLPSNQCFSVAYIQLQFLTETFELLFKDHSYTLRFTALTEFLSLIVYCIKQNTVFNYTSQCNENKSM